MLSKTLINLLTSHVFIRHTSCDHNIKTKRPFESVTFQTVIARQGAELRLRLAYETGTRGFDPLPLHQSCYKHCTMLDINGQCGYTMNDMENLLVK